MFNSESLTIKMLSNSPKRVREEETIHRQHTCLSR